MSARYLKSIVRSSELPHDNRPQIAMVGRSNVGKSSLINNLTSDKNLAHVSSSPGRTQTMNLYDIDNRYYLIDLPGYGYAKASKKVRGTFEPLIEDCLSNANPLVLVILIIDARHGPTDLDQDMLTFLLNEEISVAMIANKVDKLPKSKALSMVKKIADANPHVQVIPHSIMQKKDQGKIQMAIEDAIRANAS